MGITRVIDPLSRKSRPRRCDVSRRGDYNREEIPWDLTATPPSFSTSPPTPIRTPPRLTGTTSRSWRRTTTIAVDGLVLVSRDADGTIHEKDNAHTVGVGTAIGAAGGLLVGLIFPPAFLAVGSRRRRHRRRHRRSRLAFREEGDQGRGRGRCSARKLRDRGVVRGGLGRRHREGAAEGRQGLEARGRQVTASSRPRPQHRLRSRARNQRSLSPSRGTGS